MRRGRWCRSWKAWRSRRSTDLSALATSVTRRRTLRRRSVLWATRRNSASRKACGGRWSGTARTPPELLRQHLKGMVPLVSQESGEAPEDAEGLDRARCGETTAIERLPAELRDDIRDLLLRAGVVPAVEHGRRPLFEPRIDHARVADAVEGLHHVSLPSFGLHSLGERFVGSGEEREHAIRGRA